MEKPDYDKQLNPRVKEVEIGIRHSRKIKIYPLSIGDQLDLDDLLKQALSEFSKVDSSEQSIVTFVSSMLSIVREKLPVILNMITDEEDTVKLLYEITNDQAMEIATVIYGNNYEGLVKKVMSLLPQGMETLSATEKPLRRAARSTTTDSKTSTENPSEKEG